MPQLPQGTTALGGCNFLSRQPVGFSKCGINFFRQGTEEGLGPSLNKACNGIISQGGTLFAVFRILHHLFCVIKW